MSNAFRFGEWLVEPDLNRLSRGAESTSIEPRAMDVLVHLLVHSDRVVSPDELLDQVWPDRHGDPGMVTKRIGQIRHVLNDNARQPAYIETISKRGYRAIAPVSMLDWKSRTPDVAVCPVDPNLPGPVDQATPISGGESEGLASRVEGRTRPHVRPDRSRFVVRTASISVAALVLAYWWFFAAPEETTPERITIAAEPLTHPTNDERLEDYSRLLSSELALHLRRIAEPSMDLVENSLDANFVAKGSLTRLAEGVRLYIQVAETHSQLVIWSKSLRLPSEPTEELVATRPEHLATLVVQVASVWSNASRLTESPDAIRELIAGMTETNEMWQGLGGNWNAALLHFKKASDHDPNFVMAPFSLANLYVNRMGGTLRYEEAAGLAHAYTRRVLELNETLGCWLAGWVATHDLDYAAAAANYEFARQAGFPTPYMEFSDGLLALIQGELDDALARFSTALELGARENQAAAHVFIAYAHLLAGRYAAAAKAGRTAVVEAAGTGAYAHLLALNILARAEWYGGDKAAARARVEQAWAIYRDTHPHVFAGLFALLGDADVASEILRNNEMRWNEGEAGLLASSFWGYFHLGEYDQAYVWLLRAIEDREVGFVAALRRSPALDSIRDDPRFLGAMNRLAEIEREGTPIESVAYP